ncbi:hypothetical protein IAT38_003906 [Cryptococcus sp. DSM 104549]
MPRSQKPRGIASAVDPSSSSHGLQPPHAPRQEMAAGPSRQAIPQSHPVPLLHPQPSLSLGKTDKPYRISCDGCRAKKVKCPGEKPTCSNCVRKGLECVYPSMIRRRGPDKRPGGRLKRSDLPPPGMSVPGARPVESEVAEASTSAPAHMLGGDETVSGWAPPSGSEGGVDLGAGPSHAMGVGGAPPPLHPPHPSHPPRAGSSQASGEHVPLATSQPLPARAPMVPKPQPVPASQELLSHAPLSQSSHPHLPSHFPSPTHFPGVEPYQAPHPEAHLPQPPRLLQLPHPYIASHHHHPHPHDHHPPAGHIPLPENQLPQLPHTNDPNAFPFAFTPAPLHPAPPHTPSDPLTFYPNSTPPSHTPSHIPSLGSGLPGEHPGPGAQGEYYPPGTAMSGMSHPGSAPSTMSGMSGMSSLSAMSAPATGIPGSFADDGMPLLLGQVAGYSAQTSSSMDNSPRSVEEVQGPGSGKEYGAPGVTGQGFGVHVDMDGRTIGAGTPGGGGEGQAFGMMYGYGYGVPQGQVPSGGMVDWSQVGGVGIPGQENVFQQPLPYAQPGHLQQNQPLPPTTQLQPQGHSSLPVMSQPAFGYGSVYGDGGALAPAQAFIAELPVQNEKGEKEEGEEARWVGMGGGAIPGHGQGPGQEWVSVDILSPPGNIQAARDGWWSWILDKFDTDRRVATKKVVKVCGSFFTDTHIWCNFLNRQLFFASLFNASGHSSPHSAPSLRAAPHILLSILALVTLLQEGHTRKGQELALLFGAEAQSILGYCIHAGSQDPSLVAAAIVMCVFEIQPHIQHTTFRASSAIRQLDGVGLTVFASRLDADDDRVSTTVTGLPRFRRKALQARRQRDHQVQLDAHLVKWAQVPEWDDGWSEAEVWKEEMRRMCWTASSVAATFSLWRFMKGEKALGMTISHPEKFRLFFPGEAVYIENGDNEQGKTTPWAVYQRLCCLWHFVINNRPLNFTQKDEVTQELQAVEDDLDMIIEEGGVRSYIWQSLDWTMLIRRVIGVFDMKTLRKWFQNQLFFYDMFSRGHDGIPGIRNRPMHCWWHFIQAFSAIELSKQDPEFWDAADRIFQYTAVATAEISEYWNCGEQLGPFMYALKRRYMQAVAEREKAPLIGPQRAGGVA